MKKVFAIAGVMFALSGCSVIDNVFNYTTGVYITPEQMDQLKDNKATKKDVTNLIGHPNKKDNVAKREVWYYDYTKIKSFGKNVNEAAVFEFNTKGVLVEHYKTNAASQKSDNALLSAAGL